MYLATLTTVGDGYWSGNSARVGITELRVNYYNEEQDFGELIVVFDTQHWNVSRMGLIYTDSQFLEELQSFLNANGLEGGDVDYSEQGMQGNDYVSLDVGKPFLDTWIARFGNLDTAYTAQEEPA